MMMKKLTIICCLFSLFLSCNKIKEGIGEPNNAVYIDGTLAYRTIDLVVREGQTFEGLQTLTPRLVKFETRNVDVAVRVDGSLVTNYNQVNGTNYELLPESYYTISTSSLAIPANHITGGSITVNFNLFDPLPANKLYLLPVAISEGSGLPIIQSSKAAYYLIGDASGGRRTVANMKNNAFAVNFNGAPLLSQFTLEAMVNISQFNRLISTVMGIEGQLLFRIGDAGIPSNQMQVLMPGNPVLNTGSAGELSTNQWHHVAVVYDGQTTTVYLDGQLARTAPSRGSFNITNNFYLGYSYADDRYIDGMMCEARVWTIPRTAEELVEAKSYVNPQTPGLLAYWTFDDNSEKIIVDRTGNGYNAVAKNPVVWAESIVK